MTSLPAHWKHLAISIMLLASSPATAGEFDGENGLFAGDFDVGGFIAVVPKYEGAKEYEVIGFPIIAPSGYGIGNDGWVQFRGPEDLRLRVVQFNGFEAGPLAGWRFDRDEDDANRLRGLGDIDGGLVLGGYAAYRTGAFMPFVSYHHQVSGDDTGSLLRFGVETTVPLAFTKSVLATLGTSYADGEYMDTYFSVTPTQAASSVAGLPAYDANAGIKDVYFGLTTDVPLSQDWTLKLSGRYSRLVGDAADSPIVEDENQFYGGFGITYRLSSQR